MLVAAITLFAAFVQAVTGSGLALIAMPFLVQALDPVAAAALVALMALTTQLIMTTRYRRAIRIGALWRLALGSVAGIPIGVLALSRLDERVILTLLGVLLVAYALYGLFNFRLPRIEGTGWQYVFGFVSGLLHGAYNTGGPPYVIYGMCACWEPQTFKGNLQGLLMVNSISVIAAHIVAGHYTRLVFENYLVAAPMIVLGALIGFWLDRYLNPGLFRRLVLALLLVIGARMVLM